VLNVTGLTKKEDCRAYRVFAPWIKKLAENCCVSEDTIFKFEKFVDSKGVHKAKVYSCSLCKNETRHTPKYNLFDGVRSDGTVVDIGIGSPPNKALAYLSVEQRMKLAMLKMHDATFKAYGGAGYGHYTGGGTLTPQDYSGLMGLAVVNNTAPLTADHQTQLDAALAHLRTTNKEINNLMCVMERAHRNPASFTPESGGVSPMPAMPAETAPRPEADGLPNQGEARSFFLA
jgi:hypothetical protein